MGLFGKAKTITTLYDDGYLDDQLKKLSKILPAIKGRKINVTYVPNADRYDE